MDRSVRRGMAETTTPLAKLVVSTAHKVVVDPLQVCVLVHHSCRGAQGDVKVDNTCAEVF